MRANTRLLPPMSIFLLVALGSSACSNVRTAARPLAEALLSDRSAPAPRVADRPLDPASRPSAASVSSTYEVTPEWTLRRWGIGRPHSVFAAPDPTRGIAPTSCTLVPNGASRVLPLVDAAPTTTVAREGLWEVGVAGVPSSAADDALMLGPDDLAWRMMARNAELSTSDRGCRRSVFAFARLRILGSAPDGVAVSRE